MKKNIFFLLVILALISSTSFAANKIYTMGHIIGIVADDQAWSCETTSVNYPGLTGYYLPSGTKYIKGQSKHFPLSFIFYNQYHQLNENNIMVILKCYAVDTNTVISDVVVKEKTYIGKVNNLEPIKKMVIEASFFDNNSSGYIQLCYEHLEDCRYITFSKLNTQLLDDHSRTLLFDSIHKLKTSLFQKDALLLLLEKADTIEEMEDLK